MMTSAPVAIIGAGLAGLACARQVSKSGKAVVIFDKARGPGGRLASRRRLSTTFDIGAQFLTASQPAFSKQLSQWEQAGCLASWDLDPAKAAWVGSPRMSALTRHFSQGLNLISSTAISFIQPADNQQWSLIDTQGKQWGPFSQIVIATPASQALPLVESLAPQLSQQLVHVQEEPIWAAYFAVKPSSGPEKNCYQPAVSALRRASRLNTKPGQTYPLERWVVEATPEWSLQHLHLTQAEVAQRLFQVWANDIAAGQVPKPQLLEAHRWLYGQARKHLDAGYLADDHQQIFVCGDFCLGSSAEAAWLSGDQLGQALRKAIQ